jgi:mannose-6-phosphate isomerase-like protein (cupin superfamily)
MEAKLRVVRANEVEAKSVHGGAATSKIFANPETCGANNFSFLINRMQAGLNCNQTGLGHKHEEEHCLYTLSGKGGISIDGKKYELEPHMFVFVPAGAMHYVWAHTGEDFEYIVIYSPPGPEKNI